MLQGRLYYVLLVLCWMYALLKGGLPERIGAAVLAVGSILTVAVLPAWAGRYGSLEIGVALIDAACLSLFALIAMRANRFWPIWVSAFLALGVLGHLARWYAGPEVIPWAYGVSLTIWSYPMLAAVAIGTFNHQRRMAQGRPASPSPAGMFR